jgi:hypothetical protein
MGTEGLPVLVPLYTGMSTATFNKYGREGTGNLGSLNNTETLQAPWVQPHGQKQAQDTKSDTGTGPAMHQAVPVVYGGVSAT